MEKKTMNHLARIANCLQTILDLEPELRKLELGASLTDEFDVLKNFLEKVDRLDLTEDDVRRVEKATSTFLEELRGPLSLAQEHGDAQRRLQ
ncbi:MAG: hypothetical protein PHV85_02605 [Desulfovibrionaceae bacterium]|nr:hypothetical protein [Desulfovibrionaceae bacterium]MDD4951420.1 hypothetical protein [Desulfovibrionaceae bacterium]